MGNSVSKASNFDFKSENLNKPLYTDMYQYFILNSWPGTKKDILHFFFGNKWSSDKKEGSR